MFRVSFWWIFMIWEVQKGGARIVAFKIPTVLGLNFENEAYFETFYYTVPSGSPSSMKWSKKVLINEILIKTLFSSEPTS